MFTLLRCRLNVKLKPVVLSCAYCFRNNYILNSVYFRSLVDLENISCVRVPLVITLPEGALNQLSRRSKKPFKWFVSSFVSLGCRSECWKWEGVIYFHVQNESQDERSRNQTSREKIEKLTTHKMTFNLSSLFQIRLI